MSASAHAPAVAGTAANPSSSTSLPFTGADIGELAVVGTGAVLAAAVLVRRRRRTTS
ncbi:MAG: LPXTG cell wall anchor domain-containing protein [Acidimicrobiales bacterium]